MGGGIRTVGSPGINRQFARYEIICDKIKVLFYGCGNRFSSAQVDDSLIVRRYAPRQATRFLVDRALWADWYGTACDILHGYWAAHISVLRMRGAQPVFNIGLSLDLALLIRLPYDIISFCITMLLLPAGAPFSSDFFPSCRLNEELSHA